MNKEDGSLCHTCLNRIYNARNDLMCRKQSDCSQVQFYCPSFVSEDVYEKKEFLIKEDHKENSEKKIRYMFVSLVIFQTLTLLGPLLSDDDLDISRLIFKVIDLLLMAWVLVSLYKARNWALVVTNLVYTLNLLGALVMMVIHTDDFAMMVAMAIRTIIFCYVLYFINGDKDFKRHWQMNRGG